MEEEYHEHPFFNDDYHKGLWVQTWASGGTVLDAPPDAPWVCMSCGRVRGDDES